MSTINQHIQNIINNDPNSPLAEIAKVTHYAKGYTYANHAHQENIEINYVKQGTCYMRFDDADVVRFTVNDCMLIFPNVKHYFWVPDRPASLVQLEFKLSYFKGLKPDENLQHHLVFLHNALTHSQKYLKISHHKAIMQLIRSIVSEVNNKQALYESMVRLQYAQLFILLSRYINQNTGISKAEENPYLMTAISYIHQNYSEHISIQEVAKHCHISTRYLRKVFKNCFDISPMEYITMLRIKKAKELLADNNLSVKNISFNTGYSSPQYFSRIFKAESGLTPIAYRQILSQSI